MFKKYFLSLFRVNAVTKMDPTDPTKETMRKEMKEKKYRVTTMYCYTDYLGHSVCT